jgi:16S rRNA processing protein RimM
MRRRPLAAEPQGAVPAAAPPAGEAASLPPDAVLVASVVGAFGVRGEVRVRPFSADPQALFSSRRWFLDAPGEGVAPAAARRCAIGYPRRVRVRAAREHGDDIVARFDDVDDRDAAQAFAGAQVYVPRASFPTPAADEFYWVDLIGLAVVNREGVALGRVEGLLETGPHCVLRLDTRERDGSEVMIPFVGAYVDRVDLAARTLHVDWTAGD